MTRWKSDTGGLFYDSLFKETDLRTFDEISLFISKYICDNPLCIETGTAYGFPPGEPYWNTTSSIVKRICEPKDGILYSIDLEDRSNNIIELFKEGDINLSKVKLFVGDSVEVLKNLTFNKTIDFVCLDSGEDEDLLLDEYLAIQDRLSEKHYVLVDDIHNTNSIKYKKVVPYLKTLSYNYMQVPTETGLFVASIGYPIPPINKEIL